jgi:hypothetical protein
VAVVVYSLDADPADVEGNLQLHGSGAPPEQALLYQGPSTVTSFTFWVTSVSPDGAMSITALAPYCVAGGANRGSPGPAGGLILADGAVILVQLREQPLVLVLKARSGVEQWVSVDTLLEVRDMVVEEGGTVCTTGGAYTNARSSSRIRVSVTGDNQWLTLEPMRRLSTA